jgi:threonine aldolase
VYDVAELQALSEVARRQRLAVHVDGARFANALVALGRSPAELSWKAGVDVLAFGATKNGAMGVEAVVSFESGRVEELRQRQRRAGQQLSKSRFAAAQLTRYLEGDLWLQNARRANDAAQRLAEGLAAEGITLRVAVETNQVFCDLSAGLAARLRARGFLFHDWPSLGSEARRFVTGVPCSSCACPWMRRGRRATHVIAMLKVRAKR